MDHSTPPTELRMTENLDHPYSVCGRRRYQVGFMDGRFPDIGWHKTKEMGGIWTHPIKIADGFWLSVDRPDWPPPASYNPIRREWFTTCDEFVLGDGGAWVEHHYNKFGLKIVRREFVPVDEPALGVEIGLSHPDGKSTQVRLTVLVRFDILSAWQSGWPDPIYLETEAIDGGVVVHGVSGYDIPYELGHWAAALRSDPAPDRLAIGESLWGPERTLGNGVSCLMTFLVDVDPEAKVRFVLAGDIEGEDAALGAVDRVLTHYDSAFGAKVDSYRSIISEMTNIRTPEKALDDAFLWCKMNLEWMTQTSPPVGTCTVAGHQDFTSYFGGDTFIAIRGILASGLHQTAEDSMLTIGSLAAKAGGKVPHEFSTTGVPHDPGSAGETAYFVKSVWDTYLWTGDEAFLADLYPVCRMGMCEYIPSEPVADGVLLAEYEDHPGGARDKCLPDALAMGFTAFAQMAERVGDRETARKAADDAALLLKQIEELFWIEEEGVYASRLDENNRPVFDRDNEFSGRPFEGICYTAVARKDRAIRALEQFEGPRFATQYGVYLGDGRNCNMPVTTGKAAVAELNYGRLEPGMEFLRMMARTVGHAMPGAAPEGLDPEGDLKKFRHFRSAHWNYLQLWSAAMLNEGILQAVLQIKPDAARGTVTMTPQLPEGWPFAEFENICIGTSRINVRVDETGAHVTHVDGPELNIEIKAKNEE